MPTLQMGSRGPAVRALKVALVAQGYFVGTVDENFEEKCTAAVAYFQSVHGLKIDGIAGRRTHELLGIGQSPGAVEMTLPAPDALIFQHRYDVVVNASTETDVRVVAWFRGVGSEQTQAEATVHVPANGNATASIEIPESVRDTEGEIHVTALAYLPADPNRAVDEKASHFWIDRLRSS